MKSLFAAALAAVMLVTPAVAGNKNNQFNNWHHNNNNHINNYNYNKNVYNYNYNYRPGYRPYYGYRPYRPYVGVGIYPYRRHCSRVWVDVWIPGVGYATVRERVCR